MRLPFNIGLNWGTVALGAAVLVLGPTVLALAGQVVRSVTKTAVKGGMLAYEKGKELAADTSETLSDLLEEAKEEAAKGHKASAARK